MLNMIDMAKDLIAKGNNLGDAELVAMGMSMLDKYQDSPIPDFAVVSTPIESAKYVCGNCGHEMEYDKPGRKRCPECKKHRLKLREPEVKKLQPKNDINTLKNTQTNNNPNANDFTMQIRKPNQSRIRYDDEGNEDGTYTRTEQVDGITNVWKDDGVEGNDTENERLKAITKIIPRTRKPIRMVKAVCDICHNDFQVHPLHASGRARYICDKCIRRRSRT